MKLYKCSKFSDDCWLVNKCVCKSTFEPDHIWTSSRVVDYAVTHDIPFTIRCTKDNKIKEVIPCP